MENIDVYIGDLREAAKGKRLNWGIFMSAIDGLNSKDDVTKYFSSYCEVLKELIQEDLYNHEDGVAVRAVKKGESIDDVARSLAMDHYVLNKYSSIKHKSIHEVWNESVPELYPNGRLRNVLGF